MNTPADIAAHLASLAPAPEEHPVADGALPVWIVVVDPLARPPHAKFHSGYETAGAAEEWSAKLQAEGERIVAEENAQRAWLNDKPEREHLPPLPIIAGAPRYFVIPRPEGGKLR